MQTKSIFRVSMLHGYEISLIVAYQTCDFATNFIKLRLFIPGYIFLCVIMALLMINLNIAGCANICYFDVICLCFRALEKL